MDTIAVLRAKLRQLEQPRSDDDFSGQNDEYRRQIVVEAAVQAADELVLEGSNGSVEETDYLTSAVAQAFVNKAHQANISKLLRKQLSDR